MQGSFASAPRLDECRCGVFVDGRCDRAAGSKPASTVACREAQTALLVVDQAPKGRRVRVLVGGEQKVVEVGEQLLLGARWEGAEQWDACVPGDSHPVDFRTPNGCHSSEPAYASGATRTDFSTQVVEVSSVPPSTDGARRSAMEFAGRLQARSTSKPTMLRSSRLNSTPTRWIGLPTPRYLSA